MGRMGGGGRSYSANPANYKLLEEIGYGASAIVYRAIYLPFNEVVAVKCLDLDRCNSNLRPDSKSSEETEAFQRAMALAVSEFLDSVRFHAKSWLQAWCIVMEYLAARHDIDPSGEIMVLNRFCPWKLHLFELEERKIDPPVKYALYQDERAKQWRVQAVAISPDKFEICKPLPSQWRGLRYDEVSKEAGIPRFRFSVRVGLLVEIKLVRVH